MNRGNIRNTFLILLPFYIVFCFVAGRIVFRVIKDYNRVYYFMVHQINHMIYFFALLVVTHRPLIPKFEEFAPLVFAQKRNFLFRTKHTLKDYENLYYGLKEDLIYTEKYIDKHLHDRDQLIPIEDSLTFLNKMHGSIHFIRWMYTFLTIGIGPAVVFRPMR